MSSDIGISIGLNSLLGLTPRPDVGSGDRKWFASRNINYYFRTDLADISPWGDLSIRITALIEGCSGANGNTPKPDPGAKWTLFGQISPVLKRGQKNTPGVQPRGCFWML
jgi:hypothetical protein